jgi:hypothetical protein
VKRLLALTAALAAAVVVFARVTVPPAPWALDPTPDGTVAGIIHVHSTRSDGRGTPDEIAAAAGRAGLKFVVLTDHGDATRAPDPPAYRAGVLCLDGVEISTTGGHYVAFDMPAAPYPLGGEPRDVVEDVRRLGGFGVVAHPDSPRAELQWRDWTAPFDAIEWLNLDTVWRRRVQASGVRSRFRLFEALVHYPLRPAATIAGLIEETGDLSGWDALATRRRIVVLAGADAHAKVGFRQSDPGDNRYSLPFPAYESSFRALSIHVETARELTGDAATDAALVFTAIRQGHAYTAVDGIATPASFEFTASNRLGTVREGGQLGIGGAVTLRARSNAPPGFATIISDGSRPLVTASLPDASVVAPEGPGIFWAEVRAPAGPGNAARPWVVSNPIYVGVAANVTAAAPTHSPAAASHPLFDGRTADGWRVEHDAASLAALDLPATTSGHELRMRYGLGGGPPAGQFAALVVDLPNGAAGNDRLLFSVRAERPMRISVQLRKPGATGERWQRSVEVEPIAQEREIVFSDLRPAGATETPDAPLADVRSALFVVETTNTKPGASGRLWITTAALQNQPGAADHAQVRTVSSR